MIGHGTVRMGLSSFSRRELVELDLLTGRQSQGVRWTWKVDGTRFACRQTESRFVLGPNHNEAAGMSEPAQGNCKRVGVAYFLGQPSPGLPSQIGWCSS